MPDGHECVGSLSGLADCHDQGRWPDDRVAIAELARELRLAWDPGPVLDRVFGYQSGIEGGATRHYDDLVDATQLGLGNADLVQSELRVGVMAAQQRVSYRAGLLVDLLPHEPVVAALLCRGQVPVHVVGLYAGVLGVESDDPRAAG